MSTFSHLMVTKISGLLQNPPRSPLRYFPSPWPPMALFLFKIKKHLVSLVLSQLLPHPNIFIHATAVSHLPILARGAQLPGLRYFPPKKTEEKTPHMCRKVCSKMTTILEVNGGLSMTSMTPLISKLQSKLKFGFSTPKKIGKNIPHVQEGIF